MTSKVAAPPHLDFHTLTPDRWHDFEVLFGDRGGYGGCWCMFWRLAGSQFSRKVGDGNKRAMRRLTASGEAPGVLAYAEGQAVAWCSVGPREAFPRLERSRTLRRIDDRPMWSVNCFFVARPYRRRGLMAPLLTAAVAYAKSRGAKFIEGYPVEPGRHGKVPAMEAYTGVASAFRRAGFARVRRRIGGQTISRYIYSVED